MIYLDFETRSKASLKDVGAWEYSCHPSTEVMCLGWSDDGIRIEQWDMYGITNGNLKELHRRIASGEKIEAHSASFEICIWLNICVPKMGWPMPKLDQWWCSAGKAAACGLPRNLAEAGKAMNLKEVKDESRKNAMLKLSIPMKNGEFYENVDLFMEMLLYNEQDVVAEVALSKAIPELSKNEREVWLMDLEMNLRGFEVDLDAADAAVKLAEISLKTLNSRLAELTNGLVGSATQREAVRTWINGQMGLEFLTDTQARTLDIVLRKENIPDNVREAITLVREAGRSSIAKFRAMQNYARTDGRARFQFLYCGAGRTGRWSGLGIQPHNFTRACHKDPDRAWALMKFASTLKDPKDAVWLIENNLGPVNKSLSLGLRSAIIGRHLFCMDYSAIEARIVFWLSREEQGLEVFRSGRDVYLEMATVIYNREITDTEGIERFLGKQAILGLGFQMSFIKFLITCRLLGAPPFTRGQVIGAVGSTEEANGIYLRILERDEWCRKNKMYSAMVRASIPNATSQDFIELVLMYHCVNTYRSKYNRVKECWKELEVAVRVALDNPGQRTEAARCEWRFLDGKFLECELPSGRVLRYRDPKLGSGGKISYMSVDPKTHQWVRTETYGGKLLQGATQGSARDVMAGGMLNVHNAKPKYLLVGSVHDEAMAESKTGNLEEFKELVIRQPKWAPDLPLAAKGWYGYRYKKA